jgi:hypothetical protein
MEPIYRSQQGIGHAAVATLNAGVDLVLIAYNDEKYYDVMYAVIFLYHIEIRTSVNFSIQKFPSTAFWVKKS